MFRHALYAYLELVPDARVLNDGLNGKGAVPQLRAIGPVHLHAVPTHPQVVVNTVQVVGKFRAALACIT